MAKGPKKAVVAPTFQEILNERKKPRTDTINCNTLPPKWSFRWIDLGAPWCWSSITPDHARNVYKRLGDFEGMSWIEIQQGRLGHPIDKDDPNLLKDAPARLEEIGCGDYDLYSLRVFGAGRIWGIKVENVYYVLWWGPEPQCLPVGAVEHMIEEGTSDYKAARGIA